MPVIFLRMRRLQFSSRLPSKQKPYTAQGWGDYPLNLILKMNKKPLLKVKKNCPVSVTFDPKLDRPEIIKFSLFFHL